MKAWRPIAWKRWWGRGWADCVTIEQHQKEGEWIWTCARPQQNPAGRVDPDEWSGVLSSRRQCEQAADRHVGEFHGGWA